MSYQVLARKWRPRSFAEMVGQEHVLQALVNGLDTGRLHHAYLFTGTRGVGKTTIARIIAKCLNCEQGVSSTPCGSCAACREIAEGRFVDLIEVDAASRTKVEDTRELLDNVQYAPTRGRYKVYLIDEIHMLSTHSFNALLKTLEEPPPHVKFLLATTDPQKIPVTILSRCLQFNLKRLSVQQIAAHLQKILDAEGIAWEAGAVAEVARAADGSLRDALSLLDQAIAYGGGAVREAEVRSMLGSIEREFVFDLLEALAEEDGAQVLAVVARLAERAPDFSDALADLLLVLHKLALLQTVPASLTEDEPGYPRLRALAERLTPEDVQLYYQIALTGRRDLPLSPDPRSGFEMVLLRMLAFRPAGSVVPPAPAGPKQSPLASVRAALAPAATGKQQTAPAAPAAPPQAAPVPAARPAPTRAASAPATPPAASVSSAGRPEPAAPVADEGGTVDWIQLVERLDLNGLPRQLAMHCAWGGRSGNRITLHLAPEYEHLRVDAIVQRLEAALAEYFGAPVALALEVAKPRHETPAERAEQKRAELQRKAVETIEQDPNVEAMRKVFSAELVPNSIEPIN